MNDDHESEMNSSRKELRVLLFHELRLGRKATEVARNICSTMSEDTISIRAAQHCFNQFNSSNFELNDSRHSGRPLEVDVDVLKQLVEEDPRLTTRCLAERATWMLSYYSGNTPDRIRQDVQMWSLDIT